MNDIGFTRVFAALIDRAVRGRGELQGALFKFAPHVPV
jgi:hypothetical protein